MDVNSKEANLWSENMKLRSALSNLLQAVCGPTGFASCVREDSRKAYPWPALDIAEKSAREALGAE